MDIAYNKNINININKQILSLYNAPLNAPSELFNFFQQEKKQFNAINLATLLHNFSKLIPRKSMNPEKKYFIEEVVRLIPSRQFQFDAQSISNILRALSIWRVSPKEKIYKDAILCLMRIIPEKINNFNAINISNGLNALSKWNISIHETPYKEAILGLVQAIFKKINEFNEQSIANSLNALAKWNISIHETPYKEAILGLVTAIPEKINTFNAQAISNSLNALSKWPISPDKTPYQEAILCLVEIIPEKINSLSSQSLANSLNALAKWALPIESAPYRRSIEYLLQQIDQSYLNFSVRAGISTAFALCLLQFTTPKNSLFKNNATIIRRLFDHGESLWLESLGSTTAKQIYQINLYQPHIIPEVFLKKIPAFTPKFQAENTTSSKLQKSVFAHLAVFNHAFVEEYFIQFTHVDIASPDHKIALQVNGPSHYQGKTLNISSQFNNYLLEKLGWSVVVIPYFEWKNLLDPEKKSYLCKKLSALLASAVLHQAIKDRPPNKKTTLNQSVPGTTQEKKPSRKKKQKNILFASPEKAWGNLIEKNPTLAKVRTDELQAAYAIFTSAYQRLFKVDKIKKPNAIGLFKHVSAERLNQAIYLKKIELLSPKTISAFFHCKPCHYGLRLSAETHPKNAFTEKTIKDTFFASNPAIHLQAPG